MPIYLLPVMKFYYKRLTYMKKNINNTNKTKIVCTIGPASNSIPVLEKLLNIGMSVARLNFSHGDLNEHLAMIKNIRRASLNTGKRVAIMADLPGPKIRVGLIKDEPIELIDGDDIVLTTEDIVGDNQRISVSFDGLPLAVKPGDELFINDGYLHLKVKSIENRNVLCQILVGGELYSRKGLNLPDIELGTSAFTDDDRRCLDFALKHDVDAVSQSFVANATDIECLRQYIQEKNKCVFVIAKIERVQALKNIEEILHVADGIMVARGDLGVEIPIETMAITQKKLMQQANELGKPVITATHMLESMVIHRRPTRAEATDVANAILDGTDCVMLSGESAVGKYPIEATAMLAKIATATEPSRPKYRAKLTLFKKSNKIPKTKIVDLIASSVQYSIEHAKPVAILVPTRSGDTARNIAKFRVPVWITAFSPSEATCKSLQFSYGVSPILVEKDLADWDSFCAQWLADQGITSGIALLTQGPSEQNPHANHRMEIMELD